MVTGEVLCPKGVQDHVRENYENATEVTKDSRVVLGDNCNDKICKEGTCYRKEGDKDAFCKNVLWKDQIGCKDMKNTECTQGLTCVDNKCLLLSSSVKEQTQKPTVVITSTSIAESERLHVFTYMFIGIMFFLLITILFLLLINSSPRSSPAM
jgi:hypothetical protein